MAHLRTPIASDLVRAEGAKRYPYPHSTKGCSVVFIQLVIRHFWADFDLSGRPPDYKTVALPIELAGIPPNVSGTLLQQAARKSLLTDGRAPRAGPPAAHLTMW